MPLPLAAIQLLGTTGVATSLYALYETAKGLGLFDDKSLEALKKAGKYSVTDMPGDVADTVDYTVSKMAEIAPQVLYQLGGGDAGVKQRINEGRVFMGLPEVNFEKEGYKFPTSQGNMFTGDRGPDGSLKSK